MHFVFLRTVYLKCLDIQFQYYLFKETWLSEQQYGHKKWTMVMENSEGEEKTIKIYLASRNL